MVGDLNRIDAVLEYCARIRLGGYAFDDQGQAGSVSTDKIQAVEADAAIECQVDIPVAALAVEKVAGCRQAQGIAAILLPIARL